MVKNRRKTFHSTAAKNKEDAYSRRKMAKNQHHQHNECALGYQHGKKQA
jgi:hypothetical protein